MAEYWTREGSRVVVRVPASIVRIALGSVLMVGGVFVLVALVARETGVGTTDPALPVGDLLTPAALGLALLAAGVLVTFYRHRIVIDGAAGSASFLHDFWLFRRARVVSVAEYGSVKVDRRTPVNARRSPQPWYWVCLTGKAGESEEVVALGSPDEAERLRDDIAAVMSHRAGSKQTREAAP